MRPIAYMSCTVGNWGLLYEEINVDTIMHRWCLANMVRRRQHVEIHPK